MHDWFSHGKGEPKKPWEIEVADDDPWPDHPMKIQRTRTDPTADPDGPADLPHRRQPLVGRLADLRAATRPSPTRSARTTHGKLKIDETGLPPAELEKHIDLTGVAGNFWVGLALLHSLFMREHNAICEHLHAQHPELDDQELYDKARLVNAALMAKIHTVDWTPAIIAHPTTVLALRANWWGLEGERLDKLLGRRTSNDVVRGIPGSATDHHGVPYSLTEEFVAVYRMHPLIPDDFSFRSLDGRPRASRPRRSRTSAPCRFAGCSPSCRCPTSSTRSGRCTPARSRSTTIPKFLQHFDRPDGSLIDLAAIDILRSRERGVPRYNQFRRLFHMPAVETFEEMTRQPGVGRGSCGRSTATSSGST